MKLRSTFSLVTKETRACEAGAPLDGAPPKPLRPGRSWKKARALRSRLIDGIVVRRQCTSALSGSAPAIVIDSSAQLTARSHSDRRQSIKRRPQIWAQPWLKVEGNENRESWGRSPPKLKHVLIKYMVISDDLAMMFRLLGLVSIVGSRASKVGGLVPHFLVVPAYV